MHRSIEGWTKVLGDIPAPEGSNSEQLMAARILQDLLGYRDNSKHFGRDNIDLANAMIAYGRMMFDANVRP